MTNFSNSSNSPSPLNAFYSWKTNKVENGFKWTVTQSLKRDTPNDKGRYIDDKVLKTGVESSRAKAKNRAIKAIKNYKNPQQITIIAKRWFQKSYGNTYHSVEVYMGNEFIGREPFQYGYNSQYLQTAFDLLQDKGYFPKTGERLESGCDKDFYDFMIDTRNNPEKYAINIYDVDCKKDL